MEIHSITVENRDSVKRDSVNRDSVNRDSVIRDFNVLTVSSVGFFDATIISDIFSLCVDSVELQIEIWNCIIAILGNDTLCFFHIFVFGYRVPPIYQIT